MIYHGSATGLGIKYPHYAQDTQQKKKTKAFNGKKNKIVNERK